MKKLIFITVLAITLFSTSCTDDAGGNADMSTVDFSVQAAEWQEISDIVYGTVGYGYYVDLDFPELTNNVIQNGMVSLYMKSGFSWVPVPIYYYFLDDQTQALYQGGFYYSMKQGVFSIDYYESDGYTKNPGTQIYRLVIVQPK